MTVGSLSPVRALSIGDGACFRQGGARTCAESGGWGAGWPAFCRERFRPGRGAAGHAGNAGRGVKVFLSWAASGQGTRDHAVQQCAMESFLIHWGYAAVFLFGFLEACCVPIPSEITFGFAGVLAGEGHLNIVAVIVVGTIAELLGSYVAYGIGRAGELPLVRTFVSIVAGFLKVPPLLFGVLSLIGTAVWVTVISLIGYGVASAWQSVAHGLALAGYVIVVLAVIAIATFIAYRVREVRREEQHPAPPGEGRQDHATGGREDRATGKHAARPPWELE